MNPRSMRVVRGGSWLNRLQYSRRSYRYWSPPDSRWNYFVGVRMSRHTTTCIGRTAQQRVEDPKDASSNDNR